MNRAQLALFLCCVCATGSVTYQVTENAGACHEVRIPKWTRPANGDSTWPVGTWGCAYDVRSAGPASVYIGLSCGSSSYWRMIEKYAVDLSNPRSVRRIDEGSWDAAAVLEPEWPADPERARYQQDGLEYHGHIYPKSGPNWDLYAKALTSPGRSRVAVYSYAGIVTRSYEGSSEREHFDGTYWSEVYDVATVSRLVQIQGRFRGVDLTEFQGKSRWLGGRFFLQPLEVNGMRRLLLCNVDAAAKSRGVTESDAPVPLARAKPYFEHSASSNQLRFFEPETPQAQITGFHDEPIFYPGTSNIERVNITALLNVQVAGKYRLELDLSGLQERTQGDLGVGRGQLTVPFPVASLRELGSAGPYKIRWARLIRQVQDGQIVADNRFDIETATGIGSPALGNLDVSTQPYSLSSIGSSLYLTGQNSATLIPRTGSERDRLQVRIGFYSERTDCRGGGGLARTDPKEDVTVTGLTGEKTLVQNFTGKGISEPGPYRIEQLIIRCGQDYIRPGTIVVPSSSPPSK